MKDFMAAVAGIFGKRYTVRQKVRFINYIQNREQKKEIQVQVKEGHGCGNRVCRNVYVGNIKGADTVIAVPYDTPPQRILPVWNYYPARADKNLRTDTAVMILHILAAVILTIVYFLILRNLRQVGTLGTIVLLFPMACLDVKLIFGWGNKNNVSRNSASIVTALEFLDRYPKKAAVALLDQSCCGFWGYKCMKEDLQEKAAVKNVIVLDCISSGGSLFLHYNEGERLQIQDREITLKPIMQDKKNQSVLGLFERGVLLTGGEDGKNIGIRNTGCSRDMEINLAKMDKTIHVLYELCTGFR